MNNDTIGQILGVIAFFCTSYGNLQKDEKKLKTILALSGFIWMLNFWYINAMTSLVITLINTIRISLSSYMHHSSYKSKLTYTIIFIIINIIAGIYTYQNYFSLFSVIAAIISTVTLFILKDKNLTYGLFGNEFFWTLNNICYFNIGGLLSNTISYIIFYKKYKKHDLNK